MQCYVDKVKFRVFYKILNVLKISANQQNSTTRLVSDLKNSDAGSD